MKPERIALQLKSAAKRKGQLLTLYPVEVDGSEGERIGQWELGDLTDRRRQEVSSEIFLAAQADCDEAGFPRKYRAIITQAPDSREVQRFHLAHHPDPAAVAERATAGLGTSMPSPEGFVALTMRFSERALEIMLQSQEKAAKSLHAQIDSQQKELDQLRRREHQVMELAREVALRTGTEVTATETAERVDRAVGALTRIATAFGIQHGFLPQGFSLDMDLSKLVPSGTEPREEEPAAPPLAKSERH